MSISARTNQNSSLINEQFDLDNITPFAGANIIVDYMRQLGIDQKLEELSVKKAPWADFSSSSEMQIIMTAYMLGLERIDHTRTMEFDKFLAQKFGLAKLPSTSNLYRTLERFDSAEKVSELNSVNQLPIRQLVTDDKQAIVDIDSTVNTVHGRQEGTTVGYNSRYHGRASYQPLLAFEGNSKACIYAELRSGKTPDSDENIKVYRNAKANLPEGVKLGFVRADRAFPSNEFLTSLEEDQVGYTIKLKLSKNVKRRLEHGVLWERIYYDDSFVIEVGSVKLQLHNWDEPRKVVFIRQTEYADTRQLRLFNLWDYQAIVTNLGWCPEDIWRFYNQRCTCENFIKELKYGLNIDSISKASFQANAADLWLKVICYNILLVMKSHAPDEYKNCSISKLQRILFTVPALIVRHARRLTLRLPSWWPYKVVWQAMRRALKPC